MFDIEHARSQNVSQNILIFQYSRSIPLNMCGYAEFSNPFLTPPNKDNLTLFSPRTPLKEV